MAEEYNSFWDISRSVDPKKPVLPKHNKNEAKFYEIEFDADIPENKSVPLTGYKKFEAEKSMSETRLLGMKYIKSVTIDSFPVKFGIYENFLRDALKYHAKTCLAANYVYFFSYRPYYGELKKDQLCWYLYWRSRVRAGEYPKTGLSYIFLYMYELINICGTVGYERAFDLMVDLWLNYRGEFPRIDKYFAEWLIDFCIVYDFKPNFGLLSGILQDILKCVSLREFYIGEGFFADSANTAFVMEFFSRYDYTKSKFYTDENKAVFDSNIPQMVHNAISSALFEDYIRAEVEELSEQGISREAFSGAVCSHSIKKRLSFKYVNIFNNYKVERCVTNIVRAANNAVNAHLGVRSRLAVELPEGMQDIITDYANTYIPPAVPLKKANQKPTVEEADEAPYVFTPDMGTATAIENESWETTKKLVMLRERDAGMDEQSPYPVIEPVISCEILPDNPANTDVPGKGAGGVASLLERIARHELELLRVSLSDAPEHEKNAEYDRVVQSAAVLPMTAADSINEAALEMIGDIIIDSESLEVIGDYRDELRLCIGDM